MQYSVAASIIHYSEKEGFSTLHHLRACLDSVFAQSVVPDEVYVIDNNSSDLAYLDILKDYPKIRLIQLPDNEGTCAHDHALSASSCDFLWCITLDTRYDPDFLDNLLRAAHTHPRAASLGGMLTYMTKEGKPTGRIDSLGLWTTEDQHFKELGAYLKADSLDLGNKALPVFGLSGATVLYRSSALEAIREGERVWDLHYFMYKEDIDIAYRLRWTGYDALLVPEAIGYHVRGLKDSMKNSRNILRRIMIFLSGYFSKSSSYLQLNLRNRMILHHKNLLSVLPLRVRFATRLSDFLLLCTYLLRPSVYKGLFRYWRIKPALRKAEPKISGAEMTKAYGVPSWAKERFTLH